MDHTPVVACDQHGAISGTNLGAVQYLTGPWLSIAKDQKAQDPG